MDKTPGLGPEGTCWEYLGSKIRGYGRFYSSLLKTSIIAPRYSLYLDGRLELSRKDIFACHKCDNPPCVRPDHLFPGDNFDNQMDAWAKHRTTRGSERYNAKLTEEQVRQIKYELQHVPTRTLARQFGIGRKAIKAIREGVTWRHV